MVFAKGKPITVSLSDENTYGKTNFYRIRQFVIARH